MTDRLFGCAFVAENEAKNGAGTNNRAATYANGNAEKIKRKFGNISHFFWLKRKICTNYTVA